MIVIFIFEKNHKEYYYQLSPQLSPQYQPLLSAIASLIGLRLKPDGMLGSLSSNRTSVNLIGPINAASGVD